MALTWFRYHAEALDNMRVQNLPDHLFKIWVNLQCILAHEKAASSGKLPPTQTVAFRLRKSVEETVRNLDDLTEAGLLKSKPVTVGDGNGDESVTECDGNGPQKSLFKNPQEKEYFLKNWSNKQYKSDSSTERTQRYRERHRNVTGTPSDQIRSEQNRSDQTGDLSSKDEDKKTKAGSKYNIDMFLHDDDRDEARAAAAGWDQQHLMRKFNEWIVGKERPKHPGKAYIAWVKNFTKGKTP